MSYTIEKDIPLVPIGYCVEAQVKCEAYKGKVFNTGKKSNRYPFKNMQVGDSFLADNKYCRQLMNKYLSAARAWNYYKKEKMKFAIRRTWQGIRIWRTK